jgi:hypothetical protein
MILVLLGVQVTVIIVSTFAVGFMAASRTTFPSWIALPVLAVYPLAIVVVALLDNVLGWRLQKSQTFHLFPSPSKIHTITI